MLFLAGLADAEATVDTRNNIISYSFSSKNQDFAFECSKLFNVLNIQYKIRRLKIELKIEIPINQFLQIGKLMRHSEKRRRINAYLNGKVPVIKSDEVFIDFIKGKNITAQILSNEFNLHIDSARRILRSLYKSGSLTRNGNGTKLFPYVYF